MSEPTRGQESVFFGAVEFVCFCGLFLTPLLTELAFAKVWLLLAVFRIVAVAGSVGMTSRPVGVRRVLALQGRGLLYQLPFWTSALLFPLRLGQAELAGQALLWQLGLGVLVLLLSALPGPWLLPTLYFGSCVWLFGMDVFWGYLAVGLLTFVPFRGWVSYPLPLSGVSRHGQGFLVALSWFTCVGLAGLTTGPERATLLGVLLPWCLCCLVGTAAFRVMRVMAARADRELELCLPELGRGQRWLLTRKLRILGWCLPALALMTTSPQDLVVWLLVVAACDRALTLAAGGRIGSEALAWWACWEFSLLWGASRTEGPLVWAWLAVAGLSSWYLRGLETVGHGGVLFGVDRELEGKLYSGLRTPAPEGFAGAMKAKLEPSVDLDEELVASAPAGFRRRLLERLQAQDGLDE